MYQFKGEYKMAEDWKLNIPNDINVVVSNKENGVMLDEDCCTLINVVLKNDGKIGTSFLGSHNPFIVIQLEKAMKFYFKELKKKLKQDYKEYADLPDFKDEEDVEKSASGDHHDCSCGGEHGEKCTCGNHGENHKDDCHFADGETDENCTCGCHDDEENCTCDNHEDENCMCGNYSLDENDNKIKMADKLKNKDENQKNICHCGDHNSNDFEVIEEKSVVFNNCDRPNNSSLDKTKKDGKQDELDNNAQKDRVETIKINKNKDKK